MGLSLNKNDFSVLTGLAEYRVLTVTQLVALYGRSPYGLRRRLRMLEQEQLVRAGTRGFGHSRGRPENLISLMDAGVELLRCRELLPTAVRTEQVTADGIPSPDHQLMTNWFRIHLVQMERVNQRVAVRFLSPTSPFLPSAPDGLPAVSDRVSVDGVRREPIRFTPDGVFSILDRESQKTLLFFLEVDMGTETLASPRRHQGDVRQKIVNYQAYFRSGGYKRYQNDWSCELNGFRLLFLTTSAGRLVDLCRLVQEMPPSDFVWLTDERRMFEQGVSAEIWARGGRDRGASIRSWAVGWHSQHRSPPRHRPHATPVNLCSPQSPRILPAAATGCRQARNTRRIAPNRPARRTIIHRESCHKSSAVPSESCIYGIPAWKLSPRLSATWRALQKSNVVVLRC